MRDKQRFGLYTFILCFIFNTVMINAFYILASRSVGGLHGTIAPILEEEATVFPEGARVALLEGKSWAEQANAHLVPVLFGGGALSTILLWIAIQILGRRMVAAREPSADEGKKQAKKKEKAKKDEDRAGREIPAQPSPAPAVQILSILQRQGRFIDFIQEDIRPYDDAQIGAAVRNIHEECRKALTECMELKSVFQEEEGEPVTIRANFDTHAIRLTGNVKGDPPFKGILRHKGWQVVGVNLPQQVDTREKNWILAPAEVEIGA